MNRDQVLETRLTPPGLRLIVLFPSALLRWAGAKVSGGTKSDNRLLPLLLPLSLAACQTPAVKDRVVEVRVPVAVQPIKPDQVPAVPAPLAKRPTSLSAAADLLLAKVCELEAYALKADPLLRLSAGMQQQALAKFPECER
jgi:hypothetical protein